MTKQSIQEIIKETNDKKFFVLETQFVSTNKQILKKKDFETIGEINKIIKNYFLDGINKKAIKTDNISIHSTTEFFKIKYYSIATNENYNIKIIKGIFTEKKETCLEIIDCYNKLLEYKKYSEIFKKSMKKIIDKDEKKEISSELDLFISNYDKEDCSDELTLILKLKDWIFFYLPYSDMDEEELIEIKRKILFKLLSSYKLLTKEDFDIDDVINNFLNK